MKKEEIMIFREGEDIEHNILVPKVFKALLLVGLKTFATIINLVIFKEIVSKLFYPYFLSTKAGTFFSNTERS